MLLISLGNCSAPKYLKKNHYTFKEYITTLKEPKYNINQNLIMVMNENPFWAKINYIE